MRTVFPAYRVLGVLLLCCWQGSCVLPLEFEDEEGWADAGVDEPRVVFEPPRFVTLPPDVMPPAGAGDAGETAGMLAEETVFPEISSEPPLGPLLPSIDASMLPEVTPLVAENEFEKVTLPAFMPPESLKKPPPDLPAAPAAADSKPGRAPGLKLKTPASGEAYQEVVKHLQEGMLPKAGELPAKPAASLEGSAAGGEDELPYGHAVPGRPGLARSPRGTELQLVDVSGLAVGDRVKCPFTGDFFRVPPALEAANKAAVDGAAETVRPEEETRP